MLIIIWIFIQSVLSFSITSDFGTNATYAIYDQGYVSHYFSYVERNQRRCDCSPEEVFFTNYYDNNFTFSIHFNDNNTNITNFIKQINVDASNKYLINHLNFQTFQTSDTSLDVTIYQECEEIFAKSDFSKKWGVISVKVPNATFTYLKYCNKVFYKRSYLKILSTALLFALGSLYVYLSTKSKIILVESNQKPEGEITFFHSIIVVIVGSFTLIIIYFFAKQSLISLILTLLISSQFSISMYLVLQSIVDKNETLKKNKFLSFMLIEKYKVDVLQTILTLTTVAIVAIYFLTKHWLLNNLLAYSLSYTILSMHHLRSFRMCFWYLFFTFIYDVFWVYISPYFFESNVMVFAATSVNLPIKLQMPIFFSTYDPLQGCLMLGLGDIIIPGLTVKFLKRYDFIKKRGNEYFHYGMLIYILALCASGVGVIMFNYPQPVLFYMLPCFMFGILIKAYFNGEFMEILYSDKLEDSIDFRTYKEEIEMKNNNEFYEEPRPKNNEINLDEDESESDEEEESEVKSEEESSDEEKKID